MENLVTVLFVLAVVVTIIVAIVKMTHTLNQYERGVVFRLGVVLPRPKGPGLIILLPFDRMRKVNLQDVNVNVPPQDVITKDSVILRVGAEISFYVVDPVQADVEVQDYLVAVKQEAQANLRVILGAYELETLFAERERINEELHQLTPRHTLGALRSAGSRSTCPVASRPIWLP